MKFPLLRKIAVLTLLFLVAGALYAALAVAATPDTVGVVLLHGKTGQPRVVGNGVVEPLRQAGYLVDVPEMPWSRGRYIDKTFAEAFGEIDQAVERLKSRGAVKIVIAGHSMGADAALAYAANRGGAVGVILLAPGHTPDTRTFRTKFAGDVARAKAMIDAGQSGQAASFGDTNGGREYVRTMKAAVYYSYFDPEGLGAMAKAAAAISPAIPVLYIAGSDDPLTASLGKDYAFAKLPANPLTRYVVVTADHLGTPAAATGEMIAWLNDLIQQ